MNNLFAAKYLQHLNKKKTENNEKGFTLIELLVVVIIIGVLAAVALPNLLGQVGKARESEAKTALGALNRSQQVYRMEQGEFYGEATANAFNATGTMAALGVVPGGEFYAYANNTAVNGDASDASFKATAINPDNSGARDFASAMHYNGGQFSSAMCIAFEKATGTTRTGNAGTVTADAGAAAGSECSGGNEIK